MSTFVAIDFETSGYDPWNACSIALVRIVDGRLDDSFSSLIKPPSGRVFFTEVHGLTWNILRGAPAFPRIWPDVQAFLAGAEGLVAHNASFDRNVLWGCCEHFGCPWPQLPFYCTLRGSRAALPLPSHRLSDVCAHFRIPLRHHEALSDAQGCAAIFVRLLKMNPDLLQRMRIDEPVPLRTAPARRCRRA